MSKAITMIPAHLLWNRNQQSMAQTHTIPTVRSEIHTVEVRRQIQKNTFCYSQ